MYFTRFYKIVYKNACILTHISKLSSLSERRGEVGSSSSSNFFECVAFSYFISHMNMLDLPLLRKTNNKLVLSQGFSFEFVLRFVNFEFIYFLSLTF